MVAAWSQSVVVPLTIVIIIVAAALELLAKSCSQVPLTTSIASQIQIV